LLSFLKDSQRQIGLDQCTIDCLEVETYDCYYEYGIPVKSHFSLSLTPFPYEWYHRLQLSLRQLYLPVSSAQLPVHLLRTPKSSFKLCRVIVHPTSIRLLPTLPICSLNANASLDIRFRHTRWAHPRGQMGSPVAF
jgi:hypothetical protein